MPEPVLSLLASAESPAADGGLYKLPALRVLSEIASSLSSEADIEQLLDRFLSTMIRLAGADAGAVRVLTADGRGLRLIGAIGLPEDVLERESIVPVGCGICGQAVQQGAARNDRVLHVCKKNFGAGAFGSRCARVVAVPLQHKGNVLGVYNLFMASERTIPEEVQLLFASISEHLGMALENVRLTRENLRITLMNERQTLASEIHDSLAQTLAYMKMRLDMLRQALEKGDKNFADKFLGDVDDAVESAYTGLRELISQFRHRMDPRGLVPALEELLQQTKEKIDARVELVNRTPDIQLNPDQEVQVYRIVQEALANICKHSFARSVRIKLEEEDGQYLLSITDDGIGLYAAGHQGPGMHFGMNIMHERAERLGGKIKIKSRVGEGTQVQLTFPAPRRPVAP